MAVVTPALDHDLPPRLRDWWARPLLVIGASLLVGAAGSMLFAWPRAGGVVGAEPTLWAIFAHNLGLAAVLVLGGPYLAWPAIVANGLFLGFVLRAGASAHGWGQTLQLTAVHVPLEVLAWLVTLWSAVLLHVHVRAWWRTRQRPDPARLRQLCRVGLVATTMYLVAAGAEWLELWLVVREGSPA